MNPLDTIRRAPSYRQAQLEIEQRLPCFPFGNHPAFAYDVAIAGYSNYTFGAASGPGASFEAMCHELAHAADFGPAEFEDRCTPFGFVFRWPSIVIGGREHTWCTTGQMSAREIRVFGIEWKLREAAGVVLDVPVFFTSVRKIVGLQADWQFYEDEPELVNQLLQQAYDRFTLPEIFGRLTGWLDLTAARLQKQAA